MLRRIVVMTVVVGSVVDVWACSSDGDGTTKVLDAGASDSPAIGPDASTDAPVTPDSDAAIADAGTPALGVYTVNVDGSGLTLLVDTGDRQISHPRISSTGWILGTKYGKDPDGNGRAMEDEANIGAHYEGTQIVAFRPEAPGVQAVIAGTTVGGVAANPSWTDDGKVIFLTSEVDAGPLGVHLARASFSAFPTVASIEAIPMPKELLIPVDPHQIGPSNASGSISFSASVSLGGKWQRPIWKMPATGTSAIGAVTFVGCPICPSQGGCCAWSDIGDVLGTNDPRFNHAGTDIMWMQQHPLVSVPIGTLALHPFRQVIRPLDGGPQVDLPATGTAATTSLAYGEWRADDQEIVYWSIEIEGTILRYYLWKMNPDGSGRTKIPLPPDLCPQHPSYVTAQTIVFNAWRAGPGGTCDVAKL